LITASWKDAENRRNFFLSYSQENNFDPLNPENWYSQSIDKMMAVKVCKPDNFNDINLKYQ
jgi:hypothetical protein